MTKPSKADCLIYKALNKAIEKDQLRLYFDYGRINRPGSPVYDVWENLLPVLTPVVIGLILILSVGVIFGLAFIIIMMLIYITYFKKKVDRYLIERTKAFFTSNYENCVKLWEFGGIVLVNAENKKQGCVSPEGDWKEFVVRNYADYMLEDKKPSTQNNNDDHEQTTA